MEARRKAKASIFMQVPVVVSGFSLDALTLLPGLTATSPTPLDALTGRR